MINLKKNFFELFNLPISYIIDNSILRQRYRKFQRLVHPDSYVNATDQKYKLAIKNSAFVNKAFKTLNDPLLRAQYLLQLYGIHVKRTNRDDNFLLEQLELREELSILKNELGSLDAASKFVDKVNGLLNQVINYAVKDFENLKFSKCNKNNKLKKIQNIVQKMQFLNKLYKEAKVLEANLEAEKFSK